MTDDPTTPAESPYRIATESWSQLVTELKADVPAKKPRAVRTRAKAGSSQPLEYSAREGARSAWEVALEMAGRLGQDLGEGKYALLCINDAQHSEPSRTVENAGGSCVLLPPSKDSIFGLPKCSHAHCKALTLRQWIAAVGVEIWEEAVLQARGWRRAREFLLHDGGISGWRRIPFQLRDGDDLAEGGPQQIVPDDSPYCDFTARIVADVKEHEVHTTRRWYEIESVVSGAKHRFRIPAQDFSALSWVATEMGSEAVILTGRDGAQKLRAAIQLLSKPVPYVDAFTFTGWRQIAGRWVYLHAGGGIDANGRVDDVTMALRNDVLGRFELPAPPEGKVLRDAVRASFNLFGITRPDITVPLFGAVWRAPLGPSPLTVYLAAPTSTGKSLLVALAQQHFGRLMDEGRLPSSVKHSTAASVNELRVLVGDAVFTYDDFRLSGGSSEDLRFTERLDTVVRAQFGGTGAQRLSRDGSLQSHGAPPRSLLLITGETVPAGDSLRRRLIVVDVEPIVRRLDAEKDAAALGTYAAAMAGYLRWLAPRLDEARAEARVLAKEHTLQLVGVADPNNRTSLLLAEVAVGIEQFLRFAVAIEALTKPEAEVFWQKAFRTLFELATQQQEHQASQDPVFRFCQLLGDAISGARCHLTLNDGTAPHRAIRWGWRPRSSSEAIDDESAPELPLDDHPAGEESKVKRTRMYDQKGDHLGFADPKTGKVWFKPHIALHIARKLAADNSAPLPLTVEDLPRRLHEKGLLVDTELKARRTYTVRKQEIVREGEKSEKRMGSGYLCLSAAALHIEGYDEPLSVPPPGTVRDDDSGIPQ